MSVQTPVTPVVQLADPPTPEVGVADVLIGSFGLVGIAIALALVIGVLAGAAFILYRRWQARRLDAAGVDDDHTRLKLSAS